MVIVGLKAAEPMTGDRQVIDEGFGNREALKESVEEAQLEKGQLKAIPAKS